MMLSCFWKHEKKRGTRVPASSLTRCPSGGLFSKRESKLIASGFGLDIGNTLLRYAAEWAEEVEEIIKVEGNQVHVDTSTLKATFEAGVVERPVLRRSCMIRSPGDYVGIEVILWDIQ